MLGEKQTDAGHWQNKLSGLDSLPGEDTFNKDLAWESLSARLHKKPARKKPVWYWAAACLLPLIVLLWILNNDKETIAVTSNYPKNPENNVAPPPRLLSDHAAPVVVSLPLPAVKKQVISNQNNTRKAIAANKNVHTKITAVSLAAVIPNTLAVVVNDIFPPADTVAAGMAMVKKKLSVVHINELENPAESAIAVARRPKKDFRIMFNKIKSNNTTASATQPHASVKILLTN